MPSPLGPLSPDNVRMQVEVSLVERGGVTMKTLRGVKGHIAPRPPGEGRA